MADPIPDYEFDAEEMVCGQLAVLADVRRRLTSRNLTDAVAVVDQVAAELIADNTEEDDEQEGPDHDGHNG